MASAVLVLVGTAKGAFVLRSDAARREFQVSGPHLAGWQVSAFAFDGRHGRCRLLAGARSALWGAFVYWSDDLGATWSEPEQATLAFPADTGATLQQVWQLETAGPDEPDVVYAGVEPAALFRSDDAGQTFSLVRGLWDHPHRPCWQPGGGGLCLHTILVDPRDPRRIHVAISTGGVYRSEDRGERWQPRNVGIRADFLPEDQRYPEFGQCVHKVGRDAADPDRLYLQNHFGLYRSDDGGDTWWDVADGIPSDFGFPLVAHPRRPNTAYVIPLQSDAARWTVDGACRVYRTRTAGASWEPLGEGLPGAGAYLTVLRDAFAADSLDPAGLYFGTRTGQLFGSTDEGGRWRLLLDYLPPILCVKAAVLE